MKEAIAREIEEEAHKQKEKKRRDKEKRPSFISLTLYQSVFLYDLKLI